MSGFDDFLNRCQMLGNIDGRLGDLVLHRALAAGNDRHLRFAATRGDRTARDLIRTHCGHTYDTALARNPDLDADEADALLDAVSATNPDALVGAAQLSRSNEILRRLVDRGYADDVAANTHADTPTALHAIDWLIVDGGGGTDHHVARLVRTHINGDGAARAIGTLSDTLTARIAEFSDEDCATLLGGDQWDPRRRRNAAAYARRLNTHHRDTPAAAWFTATAARADTELADTLLGLAGAPSDDAIDAVLTAFAATETATIEQLSPIAAAVITNPAATFDQAKHAGLHLSDDDRNHLAATLDDPISFAAILINAPTVRELVDRSRFDDATLIDALVAAGHHLELGDIYGGETFTDDMDRYTRIVAQLPAWTLDSLPTEKAFAAIDTLAGHRDDLWDILAGTSSDAGDVTIGDIIANAASLIDAH